jgi:hypothetical protein
MIGAVMEGNLLCLTKGCTLEGLKRRDGTSGLSVPLRDCDRACSEKQVRSEAVSMKYIRLGS